MKTFICLSSLVLFLVAPALAQTELGAGFYQAEDNPEISYAGTWVELVDGAYSVMETSTADDSLSFDFVGEQIVFYRELLATGGASVEICIDAVCSTFSNSASVDQRNAPIAYTASDSSPHTVTMTVLSGVFRLDSLLILENNELQQGYPPSATVQLVESGGYVFGVDYTITGGDVVILMVLCSLLVVQLASLAGDLWQK